VVLSLVSEFINSRKNLKDFIREQDRQKAIAKEIIPVVLDVPEEASPKLPNLKIHLAESYGKPATPEKVYFKQESIDASKKQVGGSHYKDCPVQPTEYIVKNKLGWCEGNAVKYITRHNKKGEGRVDIEKAIHYLNLLLWMEYAEDA
jgi:hypothetical protein